MNRMKSLRTMGIILLFVVACGRTQELAAYPLAESGPYHVGMRTIKYVDESRGGRQVSVTVWYPAVGPEDPTITGAAQDAEPNRSGEPSRIRASRGIPPTVRDRMALAVRASVPGPITSLTVSLQMSACSEGSR